MKQNIINITDNEVRISTREIAEVTGKKHSHVCRDARNVFEELEIGESKFGSSYETPQGKLVTEYLLDKKLTLTLCMGYSIKLRDAVLTRLEELEKEKQAGLPNTYIAALEALVESEKKKELALATKAEIGNRREATAMNTASQAVKKANKLELELDRSKDYATVKRMTMLYHGQKFNWRELKHVSQELGIKPIEVFDSNYGTVKAYHADVWREAYALDIIEEAA